MEPKSPSRVVLEDLRRNRRKSANVRGYLGGPPSTNTTGTGSAESTNTTGSAETTNANAPTHHYQMAKNLRRTPSWTHAEKIRPK